MPHINLHSKAFRKGLLDGFTAYYVYFRPQQRRRFSSVDPAIANAWIKVGEALEAAREYERGTIGKKSRKAATENVAA